MLRERFAFTAEQLSSLLEALGQPELSSRERFEAQISGIATDYVTSVKIREKAPTRADITASLIDLRQMMDALAGKLSGLSIATGMEVTMARLRQGAADDPDWKRSLIDELYDCADVIEDAQHASARRTGPTRDLPVDWAVLRLMLLYLKTTGLPATHNPHDNLEYKGVPMSAAGRFIASVFAVLNPRISPQRICTAMERAIKEMKSKPKKTEEKSGS